MTRRSSFVSAIVFIVAASSPSDAQPTPEELRDAIRTAAERVDLGAAFQSFALFTGVPDIAGANYTIDRPRSSDYGIRSVRGSPVFTIENGKSVRPYFEVNLGIAAGDETFAVSFEGEEPTRAHVKYNLLSAVGGAGAEIDITSWLKLRPIAVAGASHFTDNTTTSGPFANELFAVSNDVVFDARTSALLYGGAMEVVVEFEPRDDIEVTGVVRGSAIHSLPIATSDEALDVDAQLQLASVNVEVEGPTPLTLFNRRLRWEAFAGTTFISGHAGSAIGFDHLSQVGAGVEIVTPNASIIDGVALRTSVLFGENVEGFSLGFSFKY